MPASSRSFLGKFHICLDIAKPSFLSTKLPIRVIGAFDNNSNTASFDEPVVYKKDVCRLYWIMLF